MANRKGKIKLKNGDVLYPETSWDKVTGRPSSLPADGGNSNTVNNHTVNSDVPANAKFTDTTYSAGSGLSLSGTTFNHSNSVTAVTAAGLYKVKYDAQGHITGTTAVAKKDITDLGIPSSDTNTTYTIATGDSNGQIKVTPSSGSAYNVSVKGLGSAAYTASTAYASSSHNHDSAYLKLTGGTLSGDLNVDKQNINGIHKASFFMSDGADSSNIMSLRAPSGSKVLELDYIDSSGNVVSFGNIATLNDIPTSYSWNSITGKPTTFTPSSHTHSNADLTGIADWAKASSKPSYNFSEIGAGIIYNAVIDTHPESSTSIIAYYASDLVNLVQRGGSITAVNKTTGATYNLSSVLDGTPSYASFSVSAVTDVVEIVIVSPTSYSWNTRFGIGFGSSNWRAKDVKIETGNSSGAWKTIYNVTNSGYPIHDVRESGPAVSGGSNPWDRIRITLTNFNNTSPRIAGIWTMNYGSIGLANNFMQKSGGTMWGSIIPGKNNGYNFGDATHVWNNAYIKTIYENGTALSSKYLGINAKASSASNADTVNGLTVQTAVPANAKFTDTTYSAVSKTAAGLCPALPNETATTKYLRQDGTWQVPPNTTYSVATTSANGLMSAADKTKLNGIAEGANNYTHPTSHPATMITGLATVATSGKYSDLSGKPTIPAADDHKVFIGDASKNTNYKLAYLDNGATGNVYLYKELSGGLYVTTDPSDASSYAGLKFCCKGSIEASAINIDGSAVATEDWVTDRGYITGINKDMVTSALGYTPPTTNTWKANSSSSEGYVASGAGKANKVWKTDANGNPAWRDDANTTYSNATTSAAGLMSSTDKSKLDGIASGANNYTHPASHPASMITGLATVATSGSYNDLSNKPTIPTVPGYGTSAAKIGTSSAGSATTVSRSDHVHAIDLATGDSNGQVKIAGTNVSVKGLGSAAYTASTAYASSSHTHSNADLTGIADWAKAAAKPGYTWDEITGKPTSFTPSSHTHTKSQITDFPTSLPANGGTATNITAQDVTIKTGSSNQSKIDLNALITFLFTTKNLIQSGKFCVIRTSWSYANNDILRLSCNGVNYELQLAGVIIEFYGTISSYNEGMFRLRIHTSPTTSFSATSGYTKAPTSTVFEYTCNGSVYSPVWRMLSYEGHTHTKSQITDFPGSVSKTAAGLCPALPNETATTKYLRQDGTWQVPPNTTYSVATTSANGLMSSSDKTKLNGIAEGANNYSLPTATASILGGVKSSTTGTTSGRDYNVQINANGTMKVNVPWTDSNTWKANSSSSEGYVSSGSGQANKVWKTDANGNPAWRDDANSWRGIQNNLTSDSTTDSLSAAQGKALNTSKLNLSGGNMTGKLTITTTENDPLLLEYDNGNHYAIELKNTGKTGKPTWSIDVDDSVTSGLHEWTIPNEDGVTFASRSWVNSQGFGKGTVKKVNNTSPDANGNVSLTIPSAANNGKITINQGGVKKGEFTVNQSGNTTIDLDAGGGGGNVNTTERGTVDLWLVGVQNSAANNQPVKTVCNHDPSDPSDLQNGVKWSNYGNRLEIYGDLYVNGYMHVDKAINAPNIDIHSGKLSSANDRFYVHPSADISATGYKGKAVTNYLYEVVPGGTGYFNITYCSSSTASPTSVSAQLAYIRPTTTSTTSSSVFCKIVYLNTNMVWTTINCYVGSSKNNTYISGVAKIRIKTNAY